MVSSNAWRRNPIPVAGMLLACTMGWGMAPRNANGANPEELHATLQRQAEAWNRGDIEAFMVAYWKSAALTFSSGGETTRGWNETLTRYRTRYPDRETMGMLHFSDLETEMLGPDAALTLGRWSLERREKAEGNFTLVWRKIDGAWKIIHDHSSAQKTP